MSATLPIALLLRRVPTGIMQSQQVLHVLVAACVRTDVARRAVTDLIEHGRALVFVPKPTDELVPSLQAAGVDV